MKTENFIKLINSITGREFQIDTKDIDIQLDKTYYIYKITPVRKINVGFDFKVPKNEENIIKSFVNTFCKKYKEPNPANYTLKESCGDPNYCWDKFDDFKKEFCYYHHSSNMYSDKMLMEQIKQNMLKSDIEDVLCKYGFYNTIYGIGIFVLFSGIYEINAINRMKAYLQDKNIPFKNEFSNAGWVYRFVINIDKEYHKVLLSNFK